MNPCNSVEHKIWPRFRAGYFVALESRESTCSVDGEHVLFYFSVFAFASYPNFDHYYYSPGTPRESTWQASDHVDSLSQCCNELVRAVPGGQVRIRSGGCM